MKLTIFAATGGIGRQVLEQAVAEGHEVTAAVRNPKKLSREIPAITADLEAPDPAVLEHAVEGADAVLSGLGPRSSSARRRSRPCPRPAAKSRQGTTPATGSSCGTCSLR
jgi:uncharacterized protein YbjT (DUF2867 family)